MLRTLLPIMSVLAPTTTLLGNPSSVTPVHEIAFADQALDNCIKKYALEQGYITVGDVKEVPCFHKGIRSIGGVEIFTEALVIDLSRNEISDWQPLMGLGKNLGYLDIHDNPILCSQMSKLAKSLPQTYLVGFDPRTCISDDRPTTPSANDHHEPNLPKPEFPSQPPILAAQYADIAPIISENCGSCHQNGYAKDGVTLDSEVEVKKWSRSIIAVIESGAMPPRSGNWIKSKGAQTLISYLKALSPDTVGQRPSQNHDGDDDDRDHDREKETGSESEKSDDRD